MTLLEKMVGSIIISTVCAIGLPTYQNIVDKSRTALLAVALKRQSNDAALLAQMDLTRVVFSLRQEKDQILSCYYPEGQVCPGWTLLGTGKVRGNFRGTPEKLTFTYNAEGKVSWVKGSYWLSTVNGGGTRRICYANGWDTGSQSPAECNYRGNK